MAIAPWRCRPVFITSTFVDMQAERDWLRQHVFPELEERLRDRRHHLEPIDLRWGVETVSVDEEHAKEMLVLKVCLDEIRRSRPFLIALVGDRYGWVPPAERMQAAVDEKGFQTDVQNKSVTALEIEFGVLESTDLKRRSHFYLREPLPYYQMPPDLAAHYSEAHNPAPGADAAAERLRVLKARIESDPSLAGRVHQYRVEWDGQAQAVTGLKDWGRQVLEDMWQDLDDETRSFVRQPIPTWQEQQCWELEQFVEDHGRGFTGRTEIIDDLCNITTSPAQEVVVWGACVTGESGLGKSALFAHLYQRLAELPDILLLAHAAGIGIRSTQVDAMLRRWTGVIADVLGVEDPLTDLSAAPDVEKTFRQFLSRIANGRRIVLLIDALDQFEMTPRARHMSWLPSPWPDNVRFIATATPGDATRFLSDLQGVGRIMLPGMEVSEARHVAQELCGRWHRVLHDEILDVLLNKVRSDGNRSIALPLWLALALDELNLLDADDFQRADRQYEGTPEQRLHQMMLDVARSLPAEVHGLYVHMLARMEELLGQDQARAFADVIAVSRYGWRESDLRELVPRAARLHGEGDGGIVRRAWHSLLRRFTKNTLSAVQCSDLDLALLRRNFRAHLVQRGAQGQWDFSHLQARFAVRRRNLTSLSMVRQLHTLIVSHLESLPEEDPVRQTETMFHLVEGDAQQRAAQYYAALKTPNTERAAATQVLVERILGSGDAVQRSESRQHAGAPGLRWVVSLLDKIDKDPRRLASLCRVFQFALQPALADNADLQTRLQLQVRTREVLTNLLKRRGLDEAWQNDLAMAHAIEGDLLAALGDLPAARQAYQESLEVAKQLLFGSDLKPIDWQRNLWVAQMKTADTCVLQGELPAAMRHYHAGLDMALSMGRRFLESAALRQDLAGTFERIGTAAVKAGNLVAATQALTDSLTIAEECARAEPENLRWQRTLAVCHEKLGDLRMSRGNTTDALAALRCSREIREHLVNQAPENAMFLRDLSVIHLKLGDAHIAQGSPNEATRACQESRGILDRLVNADPGNTALARDLSACSEKTGNAALAGGNEKRALEMYQESLAVDKQLAEHGPSNAVAQRDLSVSFNKMGDFLADHDRSAEALAAYESSLRIREQLAARDPTNAEWQRDLVGSLMRLGKFHVDCDRETESREYAAQCRQCILGMQDAGMALDQHLTKMLQVLNWMLDEEEQ